MLRNRKRGKYIDNFPTKMKKLSLSLSMAREKNFYRNLRDRKEEVRKVSKASKNEQ